MDVALTGAFFYFVPPFDGSAATAITETRCPKSSRLISVVIDEGVRRPITQAALKSGVQMVASPLLIVLNSY